VERELLVNLLAILPLAIVMIAGPQIISATLIATSQDARRNSVAFLAGVALAITAGTMIAYWVTGLVKTSTRPASQGTFATVIDWLVIVLLVVLMARVFAGRKNTARWPVTNRVPLTYQHRPPSCPRSSGERVSYADL
jgi:hypothetical protein